MQNSNQNMWLHNRVEYHGHGVMMNSVMHIMLLHICAEQSNDLPLEYHKLMSHDYPQQIDADMTNVNRRLEELMWESAEVHAKFDAHVAFGEQHVLDVIKNNLISKGLHFIRCMSSQLFA